VTTCNPCNKEDDMPNADDHCRNLLGEWVEARAELAAEMPEAADRRHDCGWTLEEAGIDAAALSPIGRAALRHVCASSRTVIEGIRELVSVARDVGYEQGIRDASLPDDEDEATDEAGSCPGD
jgi:hypothetical protein